MLEDEEKVFNGVPIIVRNGVTFCKFEDYIEARTRQGRKWSEKSFCDWCDKYDIEGVG